jgi:hypothetical protein
LCFSIIEFELCSALGDTVHILSIYVEAHRDRLIDLCWSRLIEKRVLIINFNKVSTIRRFKDSEWAELNWNLERVLTSDLWLSKLDTVSGCRHVVVSSI